MTSLSVPTMYITERLTIRRFEKRDIDALLDLFGSVEAMRFIGPRRPMNPKETRRWLDAQIARQEKEPTRFAVALRESGELIGVCGFQLIGGVWDFGYYFREKHWGRGYATEVCSFLLKRADDLLGDVPYRIFVAEKNVASQRVMERCGLAREPENGEGGEEGYRYFRP